ncbi:hypothetical protein HA41_00550 [Pantoea conspicua]|uniref:DUF2591 domain-containing protein n=1 Tax=Pantoea conspicua TaxID=472705 RepID=A0A1X1C2S0_9GAMM|nr:phage protein NinX family protein [Pantoea conspicua]ORM55956.1 hypothetical protein HA41_00550 [Pantoea conspicua]
MNYAEMTDFEINKAVAATCLGEWYDNGTCIVKCDDDDRSIFNPCNSWSDAGPIIEKENVSLTCHQSRDEWAAIFNRHCMSANQNPLRAAMECFLMKKERENAA